MATNLDNLIAAKANLTAKLVDLTVNPQPSYNIDNQQVSWTAHYESILNQIEKLNALIAMEGPYELKSSMY